MNHLHHADDSQKDATIRLIAARGCETRVGRGFENGLGISMQIGWRNSGMIAQFLDSRQPKDFTLFSHAKIAPGEHDRAFLFPCFFRPVLWNAAE